VFIYMICSICILLTSVTSYKHTLIIFGEKYKVKSCNFLQPPTTSSLLGPNILLKPCSHTPLLCALNVREQASHPYKTMGTIIALYILISTFSDRDKKTKDSEVNLVCS